MPRSLLFIVDGPLDRPLIRSQGLPLLRLLAREGIRCTILSYETKSGQPNPGLVTELERLGIRWRTLEVSSRSSGFQRLQMIVYGLWYAIRICWNEKIEIVHCRSYRPAMVGWFLQWLLGTGFVFDMRGFLIDEQVVLRRWQHNSLKYRLAKKLEGWMLRQADAVVTTSRPFRQLVLDQPGFPAARSHRVVSIPNCVDLTRFAGSDESRRALREKLGWSDRNVLIYSGEVRGWEDFDRTIAFFRVVQQADPKALLALLAYGNLELLGRAIALHQLADSDYWLDTIAFDDVPRYLGAADIGLLFLDRQAFTTGIVSPIKFGEYLASGLPVVINANTGEVDQIIQRHNVGAIVDQESEAGLREASQAILKLICDPQTRTRCQAAAFAELNLDLAVQQYGGIYQSVAAERYSKVYPSVSAPQDGRTKGR